LVIKHYLANTTGATNTAIGYYSLGANTTGSSNTAIGEGTISNNFDSCVILGRDATATASNQFVVGSAGYNAGAITSEALASDATWSVRINGTAYKILLKA
jgi:trimeric autotransporter adhesin